MVEGRIEVTGRRGRRRKQLLDEIKGKLLEIKRESSRSHSVENWLLTLNIPRGGGPLRTPEGDFL